MQAKEREERQTIVRREKRGERGDIGGERVRDREERRRDSKR